MARLVERVVRLLTARDDGCGRVMVGLAGPPGCGKSTLAAALAADLVTRGVPSVVVPMDGFHLAQSELDRLGRADRKGAPDTFDAAGYVALLRRLRPQPDDPVYAPAFRREIEEPVAGAIAIGIDAAVVITEGNYLLADGPWAPVRTLLDEVWYLDIDPEVRVHRLIERHIRHGRTATQAREWVLRSDETNATFVDATRNRADLVLRADHPLPNGAA